MNEILSLFSPEIIDKIESIDKTNLLGISLMGSYSRQEAGKFSDIDIVCFCKNEKQETQVFIIATKYIVISFVGKNEVEDWFTLPELATEFLFGVKNIVPIWDPKNYLEKLKARAIEFKWDKSIQEKANQYANSELTLLIEEVNKGIQGIMAEDIGRQLNSLFGLSHILFKIIQVKKGIFIIGDNTKYQQITALYENAPTTLKLMKEVFGEVPLELPKRVESGLRLFKIVSQEFLNTMDKPTLEMIAQTNNQIDSILD